LGARVLGEGSERLHGFSVHPTPVLRRFPGKVIPLYSAAHDDYASKRKNSEGSTR
jgi:hypothetical protein